MKNKIVLILNIVIVILAVIFVMALSGAVMEIHSTLSDYSYDEDSFIYRIEDEYYANLVHMYYDNCGSDGKEEKSMREYYDLAKYFEAAFHYKIYVESGDTVRAEKYKTVMDEAAARMGEFAFVTEMMEEKLKLE